MTWAELARIAADRVSIGLGALEVCLDLRGLHLDRNKVPLILPPDGERISADGTVGYLSGRLTEGP